MTTAESPNPLLAAQVRPAFEKIEAAHVEPAIARLIAEARERLEAIAAAPGPRTYANTMQALDELTTPLDYAMGMVRHLESVATTPALREAHNAVEGPVTAFGSSIPLHAGLWQAIKAFASTGEAAALTGARRRFLEKTIEEFRRQGAELDAAGKLRMEEIDVELARLTTKFGENVLDATNAFEFVTNNEADLAGLPPSSLHAARQSAERKGSEGWRFTLQEPDYFAIRTYLDNAAIREHFYRAFSRRGAEAPWDNLDLAARILKLRAEKAHLLGYGDFADFALAGRMAKTGARASGFLRDLREKTEARFAGENAELLAFRRSIEGPEAPELQPWDVAYYAEKQRAALYDFDEEALRPYFPLPHVVTGMFELAHRLYGVRVVEEEAPVWDKDVRCFAISSAGGERLGGFYTDWLPRENKRPGAWMGTLINGGPTAAGFEPHLGYICGNLTPPVGDAPPLLTHRDVETIFHEFGHLLHQIFSRVEPRTLAGVNVAWDWVELPSQIMENWCWERDALSLISRHWQTGETLPEELFQKMKRARNFRAANAQMRQLCFGFVDQLLHTAYDETRDGALAGYARHAMAPFSPAPLPPDYAMIAGFGHLFSEPVGYGAGYYSYKWAEALEADAFSRFRQEGIFNSETGAAFRDNILAMGDSADPTDLFRRFMGRDPDPKALLERSGLA